MSVTPFPKDAPIVSPTIREFARGHLCTIRLPGICNHDPATACWAHGSKLTGAGGIALKPCDLSGAIACSACHDVTDGRTFDAGRIGMTRLEVLAFFNEGHHRSMRLLVKAGVLIVNEYKRAG